MHQKVLFGGVWPLCAAVCLALLLGVVGSANAQSTAPLTAAEWSQVAARFGLNGKKRKFGAQPADASGFVAIIPMTSDKPHDFSMAPLATKEVEALVRRATKLYATADNTYDYGDASNNALWRGLINDPARRLKFAPHLLKAAFDTLREDKPKPHNLVDYFLFYYANKSYALTRATKTAWDHFLGRKALSPGQDPGNANLSDLFGKAAKKIEDFKPPTMQIGFNDRAFPTVYQLYGPMFEVGLDVRPEPTEDRTVARTVLSIVADIALPAGGSALVGALLPDAGASMMAASTLFKKKAADAVEATVALAKEIKAKEVAITAAKKANNFDLAVRLTEELATLRTASKNKKYGVLDMTGIRDLANAKKAVKKAKDALKAAGKVADKLDEAKDALKAARVASKSASKAVSQARAAAAIILSIAVAAAEEHLGGHIKLHAYENTLKDAIDAGVQSFAIESLLPRYSEQNGLYYPDCVEGFEGKGPVCWQRCPEGSRDNGATCWKTRDIYGRGVGYVMADKARCDRESGTNCEQCLALVYPQCRAGYEKTTCNLCQSKLVQCPEGMIDRGDWCEKGSYGRGAGLTKEAAAALTKLNRVNMLNTLIHMMIADPAREGVLSFASPTDSGPVEFTKLPGTLQHIEAGTPWQVWGRQADGAAYRWNGAGWDRMPGQVKQLSVGADGDVWALGMGGEVYQWDGLTWARKPGTLRQISVGNAQNIWGVQESDAVFKWNGAGWDRVAGELEQVAVGGDGTVWGIQEGQATRRTGNGWSQMQTRLRHITVGAASHVWGIDDKGRLAQWTGAAWVMRKGEELAYLSAGLGGGLWGVGPKQTVHRSTTTKTDKWDGWNVMHAVDSTANARLKDRVNNNGTFFFTTNAGPDACSKHYDKSGFKTSGIVQAAFMDPTKVSFRATLCRGPRVPLDQITYVLPGDVAPPAGSLKMGFIKPAALAASQWQGLSVMRLAPGNTSLPPQAKHYLVHNNGNCAAGSTKSGWIKNTAFDFRPLSKGYTVFPAFGATICTLP